MNVNHGQSTQEWRQATALLEKYYHLQPSEFKQTPEFQTAAQSLQDKILKLLANKKNDHTLLNQPAQIFKTLKNHDLSGEVLGSYQLVQLLAHGGMSSVYRARKIDTTTQKDVAIKLIPTSIQTQNITTLFKQELETLSKLHHPNIIAMHHGGIAESGTPYLVMQLVEHALQIDRYIQQSKVKLDAIIDMFITLCNVLHYAHQNQIIHQDIKPSNVLVDQHGHLQVLDFGVATIAEALPEHHAYTLSYAAPEQRSKDLLPNASFDTYAITSLLIKCLSQCPDNLPNWQQTAIKKLRVNNDLKLILKKGIGNAKNRYPTAAELAMDLSLWQKSLPVSFLSQGLFYRFKKFTQRQPAAFVFASLTFLSVLTGLIFFQQQYRIALSESTKAKQVKDILMEAIHQNDPDISKGSALTVRDMLKQVELSHNENPVNDDQTSKELFMTLGTAFQQLGDFKSAEVNIQKALNIVPNDINALLESATIKIQQKQTRQTQELLTQIQPNLTNTSTENQVKYHLLSAQTQVIDSDFEAAQSAFLLAISLVEKTPDVPLKIKTMSAYADGLLEQDQIDPALSQIQQAIALSTQYLGAQHSLTLGMKAKLAETYLSHSGTKVEHAIGLFEALIPQQQALLGNNHPMVAKSLFLNATAYRSLNQLEQAKTSAQDALIIAEQQFGRAHVFTGKILMALGGIYLAENNINQAISYAKLAVSIHENHFGTDHHETLQYKTSYVAMLVKNEQHEEAFTLLLQILPIQTAKLGPDHRATLYVEIILSKTYAAMGDLTQGVAVGERCLNNARKSTTKNIMEVYCALTLENAYFLNQQYPQASKLIQEYGDDPLIVNHPTAKQQFANHSKTIDEL